VELPTKVASFDRLKDRLRTDPGQAASKRTANPASVETLDAYLERLASDAAVPGGGSAAALVGSLGAALIAMVARITLRNPERASSADALRSIVASSDALRTQLATARERDEAAYAEVVAAQALSRATEVEKAARRNALDVALERAAEAPLEAAALNLRALEVALELVAFSAPALNSDVGCAAEFAHAALLSCAYNVRVNHRFMKDARTIAHQAQRLGVTEAEAERLLERVRAKVSQDLGGSA
jgi:methenyltetrahydrofolate cyclohydrolase